jgi:hypothetical protein
MMHWHEVGREARKARGLKGREWLMGPDGLSAGKMCENMALGIDNMLKNWKGREKFNIHRHDEYVGHNMPNKSLGFILPKIDRLEAKNKFN